ncbi:hypothetical protein ACFL22_00105 [Patescibacteria group bacterium]
MNIETINFILDITLMFMSVWMIWYVVGFGGFVNRAFKYIAWGGFFMGIAHLQESLFLQFFDMSLEVDEFIHRVIVFIGFVLLVIGFRILTRKNVK